MPDKPEKPAAPAAAAKKAPRKAVAKAPAGGGANKKEKSEAKPAAPRSAAPAVRRPSRQQVKVGRVVSNKMTKTVIVAVENTVTHRLYHRYMKRTSKFAAHDADGRCQIGDQVAIVSSRPLSKTKRWRVREVLKRAAD